MNVQLYFSFDSVTKTNSSKTLQRLGEQKQMLYFQPLSLFLKQKGHVRMHQLGNVVRRTEDEAVAAEMRKGTCRKENKAGSMTSQCSKMQRETPQGAGVPPKHTAEAAVLMLCPSSAGILPQLCRAMSEEMAKVTQQQSTLEKNAKGNAAVRELICFLV